jgi:hypothetical protein
MMKSYIFLWIGTLKQEIMSGTPLLPGIPMCVRLNVMEQRREESFAGIPAKTGYDRDEWPMAMCEEGGAGASVRYVTPSDNRGAGGWVGNQLENYPDGTRVLFITD